MKKLCVALAAVLLLAALAPAVSAFDANAVYGDANGDGKVNSRDVTLIMRSIVAGDMERIVFENADVNVDGKINSKDVVKMMKSIVGINTVRLGHDDKFSVVEAPTCQSKGVGLLTCRECGSEATVELALEPHSYEGEVTTEPTCVEPGVLTMTCTVCGDTRTERIEPTGQHAYTLSVISEPTCNKRGVLSGKCISCGLTETVEIAALGHDYTEDGRCSVCGKEEGWWYISQYVDEDGYLTNIPFVFTFGVGAYDTSVVKTDGLAAAMILDFDKYGGIETLFCLYKNGVEQVENNSSRKKTFDVTIELQSGTLYCWTGTMAKGDNRIVTDIPRGGPTMLFKAGNDVLLIKIYDVEHPDEEYAFYIFSSDYEDALTALQ